MSLFRILQEARECTVCLPHLPLGAKPLFSAHPRSRIVIIGQAPGQVTHRMGIPWSDRSGDTLRRWLGISSEDFYDPVKVALLPMGFCYPGTGKNGDFEPRPECAPLWHSRILPYLTEVRLTLYLGRFAVVHYLGERFPDLTEAVESYKQLLPKQMVLPHPSPRNGPWLKKRPWFEKAALPRLRDRVQSALRSL